MLQEKAHSEDDQTTQAACCTHWVLALALIVHLEPGIASRHTVAGGKPVKVHTLVGKALCSLQIRQHQNRHPWQQKQHHVG